MYKSGVERFHQAGYVRYEVCSFAKPGHECRHNIGYWEGRDYLGLGPSAHSFINGQRFLNASSNVDYVKALENGELPREVDQSGIEERMVETILLGLRTTWGVSRAKFERVFENKLEEKIDLHQYDTLVKAGHLVDDGDAIKLSDDGFYIVEEVTRRLVK
ncbi:MAG: hypothetical protein DWP97_07090 [Calditrichaeota bacterium]|nr:MAG: hypothetical protein DWP97_07090 [Calditrichota bacterium]